ncbi:hypothetical protein AVEN_23301-1 [Araneus ventricosus]|uniref:Mos1 transposase HTH domain-containing protein n=1 Tax=Araneus ventricosus TaxID=182803 RepID=A0A4Y2QP06_ARAVE|nr:hypothetical protein AVEN_23301-1 [Araneus ventricosus]
MTSRIDAPAKCELRSVIRFLQAEGNSAAEIHRRMSRVYSENFKSDGVVRERRRKFKNGLTDVHDEEGQGRKFCRNKSSTSFPQLLQHFNTLPYIFICPPN